MIHPPLFVTFEGVNGCGKTTLISRLAQTLIDQKYSIMKLRDPGGTLLGEAMRKTLFNPVFPYEMQNKTRLMLFLASRSQNIKELIQPALKDNKIVLCDRFNDSSIVYQGAGEGLGMNEVRELCDFVCNGLTPDLTFLLDIDVRTAIQRKIVQQGNFLEIDEEDIAHAELIKQNFLHIAWIESHRFAILNAHLSPELVCAQALDIIKDKLSNKDISK